MASSAKTIMLVDDDIHILTITAKALKLANFDVHSFSHPTAAVKHLEDGCKSCSILVCDIRMGEPSGFQLARTIKDLRPDMKIILMTAFEVNKREIELVLPSAQIDDLIKKPFTPSQLVQMIALICSSRRLITRA